MTLAHNPPLVLVADDETHTTAMLTRVFEREGFQVESVHDGIAALNTAQRILPDLILLDVQMPLMNGFDVLRSLRTNPLTESIPTIIITAKARQPTDVAHGLDLGADDFVHKPFDPRELLARAQSKIRARKLEEALQRGSQELEALLRVGEELNQHLELKDLLTLVPYLVLDLLPGSLAAIYQLNEKKELVHHQIHVKSGDADYQIDNPKIIRKFLQGGRSILWPDQDKPLIDSFASGMVVPLQHGSSLLGVLLLGDTNNRYDESHFRLFEGIGRQASLALRNAQLYEIQSNYALHLQDMVDERTAELRSAQEMLIRAEKLASIGHLAASIAHEINNPLQPIRINLEDMIEDVQRNVPIDVQALRITHENVERIWRIVKQLLDFAGKRSATNTELEYVDVKAIIEGLISLNKKFFEKENMRIVPELKTALHMYGNKDQLEQVFMNLIINAGAAMTKGGVLTISGKVVGKDIVTKFTDTGSGIPPEQLSKIFDPFFSTKPNGTGLGLFVSYGIVESHQGTIEVQSEVNKGTSFTVRLPAHTDKS